MPSRKPPPKPSARSTARSSARSSAGKTGTSSTRAAAKSSAKATVSGPTRKGGADAISDAATAKIAGAEALASAMPHNAAKPGEFGDAAMAPPQGQAVEPPHPMVGGSTLTEVNASEKVGRGNPQVSFNPTVGPL